jgi:hypothetical protein
MKTFLLSIFICSSALSFGQITVEIEDHDLVLYRGYANKCMISSTELKFDELIVDNGSIQKGKDYYIITPGAGKTCSLYALRKNKKNIDTIDIKIFNVKPLPKPELYLGSIVSGENLIENSNLLYCKYSECTPLNIQYDVVSWELNLEGRLIQGVSNELSTEAMDYIKGLQPGETLTIKVKAKTLDNYTRIISGFWIVK